jgi:hypothetical protein
MITQQKHSRYLVGLLAAVAMAGCVKSDQANQRADSTARNLTLAPTESTAAMKDVPAPVTEPAKPAPEKKASQPAAKPPAPKPAAPTTLTAVAGTRVPVTVSESISTRQAKAGDSFSATVAQDVKDAAGHVVIPAGSAVQGTIVAAEPAPNPNASGRLELAVQTVTVRGASYAVDATVESKDTVMQGRGVTKADAAKVGGGAVAGALVGKLLGKNAKGAVIGGAVGAAAGAAAARASRDIDVVLPKGAAITLKLNKPLTVKRTA